MLKLAIWQSMMLFGWTETKLWTLKYGSKSIQTSLILRQRPPKPYKLLKFFISFVTTVKSPHAPAIWKKPRWKLLCLPIFKEYHGNHKHFKSLYGFGWRCLKIRDVCMDFEPYFKVHSLVSVHSQSIMYLVKESISTWSFMWWYQFIDLLKSETRPSFLLNFGTANSDGNNNNVLFSSCCCLHWIF